MDVWGFFGPRQNHQRKHFTYFLINIVCNRWKCNGKNWGKLKQVFITRAPPELAIGGLGTELRCRGNISAAKTAWDLYDEGRGDTFGEDIAKEGSFLGIYFGAEIYIS